MSRHFPMIRSSALRIAFVFSLALDAGCGTIAAQEESSGLATTLQSYANVIRWGDFEQAMVFVDPQTLKDHPLSSIDLERYKQVKVSSYNDEEAPTPAGPHEVHQIVHISIVNINTQTERTIVDRQLWRYDPEKKHWHLVSGLPDITQH